MMTRLQYRRQFLLAAAPIAPLPEWSTLRVGGYFLYAHPDLEVTSLCGPERSLVLLGCIFDPRQPEKRNADILADIHGAAKGITDLFRAVKQYAGCYALLYQDAAETIMLHDALALREIYYCTKENRLVCGSQPNLLAAFGSPGIGPSEDPDFLEFYARHSKDGRWNPARKWIGDETCYRDVRHLLPNHFLDIRRRESRRYWPLERVPRLTLEEAVERSCSLLQGTLRAMAVRHPLMMAVTAGTDSRTLLAASRGLRDKIYYFVNDQGLHPAHPDIAVPRAIFEGLELPFHVHWVSKDVDAQFRDIFLRNTFFASDRILPTIYNVYFKQHSDKVNILGIGEIGRTRYGSEPLHLDGYRMIYKLGYRGGRYETKQARRILEELLPVGREYGVNVLTLLYWEHTLGNWGATGNSESDIAIEELNPYDSHLLYETFLGVDPRHAAYTDPVFFREMIRAMWPELLAWPINPPHSRRDKLKSLLVGTGAFTALKELKYRISYLRFRRTARLAGEKS